MQLTKFDHACFMVEVDGKTLVVDPGNLTQNFMSPDNVAAIVVTHEHPDHFDPTALNAIIAHNPEATIYAHQDVTQQLDSTLPHQSVGVGETVVVGPFTLAFSGGDHAIIHPQIPRIANLGVTVNHTLYYPGDSLTLPGSTIKTVMLPVSAPWCSISQVVDFLLELNLTLALPTHDAILSPAGKVIVDRVIAQFANQATIDYRRIESGSTLTI